jgi:hypothetical protein
VVVEINRDIIKGLLASGRFRGRDSEDLHQATAAHWYDVYAAVEVGKPPSLRCRPAEFGNSEPSCKLGR